MTFVSAIVLAAGESTRMGEQKALLDWHGVPLIEFQLTQLLAVPEVRQVIVVTGHAPAAVVATVSAFPGAAIVHNPDYKTGKVSSIRAGVRAVSSEAEAGLLIAVDQPRSAGIIRELIASHAAPMSVTIPVRHGRRGHPVLFARSLLPELLALSEEAKGIRAVLDRHATLVRELEIDDPAIHVDLNTPADLEDAPA
jgi:molybdenum cofactor cytidylyltransferase